MLAIVQFQQVAIEERRQLPRMAIQAQFQPIADAMGAGDRMLGAVHRDRPVAAVAAGAGLHHARPGLQPQAARRAAAQTPAVGQGPG